MTHPLMSPMCRWHFVAEIVFILSFNDVKRHYLQINDAQLCTEVARETSKNICKRSRLHFVSVSCISKYFLLWKSNLIRLQFEINLQLDFNYFLLNSISSGDLLLQLDQTAGRRYEEHLKVTCPSICCCQTEGVVRHHVDYMSWFNRADDHVRYQLIHRQKNPNYARYYTLFVCI